MADSEEQPLADETGTMDLPATMFRTGDVFEIATVQMEHRRPGFANPSVFNVDVEYTSLGDLAIFEGDIVLGDVETIRNDPESRGIGRVGEEFRWPDGLIPYVTQEALKPRVDAAIAHWEEHTAIRFKQREDEPDYISFEEVDGCWSSVGRIGGKQKISLVAGCSVGSTIHEIGHALGLWHEQSRSDRDEFIEIHLENVSPGSARSNFAKHIQDGMDLGEYDFKSIMHYPAKAFGRGKVTIRTKNGEEIGQRNGLSKGDVAAIKMLYPDLAWPEEETDA